MKKKLGVAKKKSLKIHPKSLFRRCAADFHRCMPEKAQHFCSDLVLVSFSESQNDKGDVIELDKIQVKGKTEPETIFGLFNEKLSSDERKSQEMFLDAYKKGDYHKSSKSPIHYVC